MFKKEHQKRTKLVEPSLQKEATLTLTLQSKQFVSLKKEYAQLSKAN